MNKTTISQKWNKFILKIKKIPHLFSKVIVVWCIMCGTTFSVCGLFMLYKTGLDASNLLIPILGFFGGELAFLFGKTAVSSIRKCDACTPEDEEECE